MRNRFDPPRRARLTLEHLEDRDTPAVTVQIDYSFDTNGFFADPLRRAVLQQAVNDVAAGLNANLPALTPGGGNTWDASFFNPATGGEVRVANRSIPANTIVLYAGGRDLAGADAGSQAWFDLIRSRGPGFTLWGGALSFDTSGTNWFFGTTAAGIGQWQVDFYSVAAHEFGHALGLGTAPTWHSQIRNGAFAGPNATALYGGPVPLAGTAHWADGVAVNGVPVALDPTATLGARSTFSALDVAALRDVGWNAPAAASPPASPAVPPASPPAPPAPPAPPPFVPVPNARSSTPSPVKSAAMPRPTSTATAAPSSPCPPTPAAAPG